MWVKQPAVVHNLRASIESGSYKDHPVALALMDCIAAHACKQGDNENKGWRYTPSADLELPPECLKDFNTAMLSICKPRGLELFSGNSFGPLTRTVKRWRGPLLMDPSLRRERVQAAAAYLRQAGFSQHADPPIAVIAPIIEETTIDVAAATATAATSLAVETPEAPATAAADVPIAAAVAAPLPADGHFVPLAHQRLRRHQDAAAPAPAARTTQAPTAATSSRNPLAARLATLPPEEAPYTPVCADAFKIILSAEASCPYPHVRIMDETRLAQAVLRDHTTEKRLHGWSAMPRIVLLEFVPTDTTIEHICAWLAPLEVQRRQGKLELFWCRASDEDEGVEFTMVAETEGVAAYKMCHLQLVSYQQWLLALELDGTMLNGRAVRVRGIEDRPIGVTKDDIDAAFLIADLTHRPKATYHYVEVASVAYPGIAEVETAAICTNNRYLQITDLARLSALTIRHANNTGILLVNTQTDGDARFRHLAYFSCAFLLRLAQLANRATMIAHRDAFVAEVRGYGFPLPDLSPEDAACFVIPADLLQRWPGANRLGLPLSARTPFYSTLPPIRFYLGLRLNGWRYFVPIIAGLPRSVGSDIYHGLRKLINIAPLAMNKLLLIGSEKILFAHFTDVIERAPETGLLHDHLDAHMKQDHQSALKKISQPVIDALETLVPGARGTAWLCTVGRDWWRAWYDDRLRPLERMKLCLLTTRRLSMWKESLLELDLYKESGLSLELDGDSFINCFDMVGLCIMFKLFFPNTAFCAWLFTSYRVECRFEVTRYMIGGSTESALTALVAIMRGAELQRLREALTRSQLGKNWQNRRRTHDSDHTATPEDEEPLLDHGWSFAELCSFLAPGGELDSTVERELGALGVDNISELLAKHSLQNDQGLQMLLDQAHNDLEAAPSMTPGPPPPGEEAATAAELIETIAATGAGPEEDMHTGIALRAGERDFDGPAPPPAVRTVTIPSDDGFMASGPQRKAARRAARKAPAPTTDPNSYDRWERTHVVENGIQMSAQQYINSQAITQRVKARVVGMGKQAVATQESIDAQVRAAEFKRHSIVVFPFTGSGAEVGRIRQVAYRTNAGYAYINGVPQGLDRDVKIFCDWFVVDEAASALLHTQRADAEDARLAALPNAEQVERVFGTRLQRGVAEFLVRWKGHDASHDSWETEGRFLTWVNGKRALTAFRAEQAGGPSTAPMALVYKQVKLPPDQEQYYELVTGIELLQGVQINDSDLDYAVLTLLPEHEEQLARAQALAMEAESDDED